MTQQIHRRPGRAGAMALALALTMGATGRAQVGPEESAKKLKPAEGFEATLWAAEPMVVNPTGVDVDSRGRVWVTEGLNYRPTRNRSLPPRPDADKIKILQDTDGDGKADKVTVFADKIFPVPMGIAVEEDYGKDGKYKGARVFVGNSPDILVLEDTDGDDVADKRYPLLSGFGGIDSDHGVHGTYLGPDGKLYFTHGDGCCSVRDGKDEGSKNFDVTDKSGRHVSSDQLANTLRANRDGTQFESIADRQRNNYETCVNSFGNGFTSDNDDDGNRGCRVIWVMDGGHYGYHTPGSPRHWGEDVPGNVPKLVGTGNGSPCGVMVYEGNLFPKEFAGAVLEAEAGPRVINYFPLTRAGASFRTEHKVLLASDDPWFRPVDVCAAPDGSLIVADWYDAGVGGHAFKDQTTGRIYRIVPKGAKPESPRYDFASIPGLIDALKSPVVATRDTARRLLVERGKHEPEPVVVALMKVYTFGDPVFQARALWALSEISGDKVAEVALKDPDPRIREQAVRMLGRDVSRNAKVEYTKADAKTELAASKHLKALLPLASDPDAGVRRELILALRDLPTKDAGDALKTLTRAWDGQDRWYLEALGLALERRDAAFVAELFDGTLYGDLDLAEAGQASKVALPPYFPVDRNEAYIAAGERPLPASALSKTLGLSWRLHRPEALPLLGRILPALKTPDLQQAGDDAVTQVGGAAVALADLALKANDPLRRRQFYEVLARRLETKWRDARNEGRVVEAITRALADPEQRVEGIAMAAATREGRYADALLGFAGDAAAPAEVRAAAVEALGAIKPPQARATLDGLIGAAREKGNSYPAAEAAIRTLPKLGDARDRLVELATAGDVPLGLRREALRTFAIQEGGARRVIALAKDGKLPDDLKTEASTLLMTNRDPKVRDEAAAVLPPPKAASGRPLPPFFELVRRDGHAERGRDVFYRAGPASCAGCHRVQGRGRWIGPDLSTIGTKYGKDELLRSILNPSAAIGYNYRSVVVGLDDGRVLTGLAVDEDPDRLVLKTAQGERVAVKPSEIQDRKLSDVSLMPEGLAQSMTDAELVDLLAFLSTLRQPVSIVGQYQAIGPLAEKGRPAFDVAEKVNPALKLPGADGPEVAWRRLTANADGRVDLGPLAGSDSTRAVYLHAAINSPAEQEARLVLDTRADVKVWLGGKAVPLPGARGDDPRAVAVNLPRGATDLLIRVPGGADAAVVTTVVSARPVEFGAEGAKVSTR